MTSTPVMRSIIAALSLGTLFAFPAPLSAQNSSDEVLTLRFDNQRVNSTISSPHVTGSAAASVTASTLALNGGKAITQPGPLGPGGSMRLPAYTRLSSNSPLAVVSIRNRAGSSDPLDPGSKRFAFMADFSLDDTSSNSPSNSDGDNIFQRGLSPTTQWQLSVDGHNARCTVRTAGAKTAVRTPAIKIPRKTTNRSWYRAVCQRDSDTSGTLTLIVSYYDTAAKNWKAFKTTRTQGARGSLSMSRTIPVSIGGKLNTNNTIQRGAPDQFNGLVDNVRLVIG